MHTVFEWKTKKIFVKSKPFAFRLEPSAICNLKCPACPTPKKVFKPGQVKIMSLMNFKSIYEKISKYACRMTFYMEGEPMTNPYLWLFRSVIAARIHAASGWKPHESTCHSRAFGHEVQPFQVVFGGPRTSWTLVCFSSSDARAYWQTKSWLKLLWFHVLSWAIRRSPAWAAASDKERKSQ